jgi:transmembrane sensor
VIALLGALQAPASACAQQREPWRSAPRRAWPRVASAAAAVLTLGLLLSQTPWLDRWRADYATATGESRSVQLADGSRIQLNTDSALQVELAHGGERCTCCVARPGSRWPVTPTGLLCAPATAG